MFANETTPTVDLALVRAEEAKRIAVIEQASKTVVCVLDESGEGGGSGVIVTSDGQGLTNFHVVAGMLTMRKGVAGLSDGKRYPLEVLGIDPTGDLAMFRLTGRDRFDAAELGDSDRLAVGDPVFAAGNPFMLAEDFTPTVTAGIISGLHRYQFGSDQRSLVYTDCIQVDASINPGNSGGPLFDAAGRLIGINGRASFQRRGRINVGVAYAISINQAKRFIPGLQAGLLVEHGTLGATVIDLGYQRVVFKKILEDSPAWTAGIRGGDRLIAFAGHDVHSANQFANLLGTYPATWPVPVTFEHEGEEHACVISLARLPAKLPDELKKTFQIDESVTAAAAAQMVQGTSAGAVGPSVSGMTWLIEQATKRTVKLHGGKLGSEVGYGSGAIVSDEGHVVTVLSLMLDAADLRAVTHDGHVYPAEVIYRDEYRQMAMLKLARFPSNKDTTAPLREQMEPTQFEPMPVPKDDTLQTGDWVLAAGNPFKVADGSERVSILKGIVTGTASLDADKGTQPFPYRGPVILVDAVTSNPGSPGSALLDLSGRWVGLVGEIVTSRLTNTDLNYAFPMTQVKAFIADALATKDTATHPALAQATGPGYHGIKLSNIGYRRRLPFVQSVAPGSPAEKAGVQPDDLVVSANGTAIPRARVFDELCDRLRPGDMLSLIVKRGEELITLRFELTETPS